MVVLLTGTSEHRTEYRTGVVELIFIALVALGILVGCPMEPSPPPTASPSQPPAPASDPAADPAPVSTDPSTSPPPAAAVDEPATVVTAALTISSDAPLLGGLTSPHFSRDVITIQNAILQLRVEEYLPKTGWNQGAGQENQQDRNIPDQPGHLTFPEKHPFRTPLTIVIGPQALALRLRARTECVFSGRDFGGNHNSTQANSNWYDLWLIPLAEVPKGVTELSSAPLLCVSCAAVANGGPNVAWALAFRCDIKFSKWPARARTSGRAVWVHAGNIWAASGKHPCGVDGQVQLLDTQQAADAQPLDSMDLHLIDIREKQAELGVVDWYQWNRQTGLFTDLTIRPGIRLRYGSNPPKWISKGRPSLHNAKCSTRIGLCDGDTRDRSVAPEPFPGHCNDATIHLRLLLSTRLPGSAGTAKPIRATQAGGGRTRGTREARGVSRRRHEHRSHCQWPHSEALTE